MTRRGRTRRRSHYERELAALGAARVVAVDASAYFSRPGPRLIDGLELLAHILHPERCVERPARRCGRAVRRGRWRPLTRRLAAEAGR